MPESPPLRFALQRSQPVPNERQLSQRLHCCNTAVQLGGADQRAFARRLHDSCLPTPQLGAVERAVQLTVWPCSPLPCRAQEKKDKKDKAEKGDKKDKGAFPCALTAGYATTGCPRLASNRYQALGCSVNRAWA